ncbi:WD repeat and HMG-box DNA-binding protein 1 [Dorcoceras hygrometricum]|uniref:WD repeat and HMG-box DNA-binding protein 1 n=1 Tax=Dorcoceras hygrometricum TaxID=472368 RepID=A0A2Z7AAQ8_9LAMI|nr:WD repeat and HMG-box DNA-binding protein 1 [Dorcoceras hygrometricum]
MKIRTMKLREAHKNGENEESSFCSVLWDSTADHIVTASSADNSICIHDAVSPSNPPKFLNNHREGVTVLALSPNSTCLASGSIDHSVKLYKFPGGDFETNITRFTLPIRALAFNKSGTILAAAGDDEGIKLVNTIDGTIARVLKGHKGSITSIAFDPKNEYLASLDSIGTVIYWELQSGCTLHVLKAIAPNNASDVSAMNILAWSPDGEMLAVPGLKNDVVMYDRDTAERLFSLRGDHLKPICFLSWSPNGKYLATSGLDQQILIWDVDKKQDIDRQKFSELISCMAWKPHGNALAVIDVMGKYGVWESAVPSPLKSPTEDIPELHSKNGNGFLLLEEEEDPSASGSLSDLNEDSFGESLPKCRKRLREQGKDNDEWKEDSDDELDSIPKFESRKKPHHSKKDNLDNVKSGSRNVIANVGPKMQGSFQSGATPAKAGKRNFLCYNMLGSITTMEHDGYSHIEIDFHDTSRGPRVPAMTDYFGFTMASLSENGCAFANPCKGEKNMSTLMYRPFSTWANNSEWSMRFEGEEVRAVALGNSWVAAVTSINFLRIFTHGGLQRYIFSLDGPVVTAAGFKDELAVVMHVSPSLPSDEQMLEFRVFNIHSGTQPLRGRLPLTPGSCLTWFGFSDDGQLSSFDSKGVLRVYTNLYGGSWLPLFSVSKLCKSEENYWVVGLNKSKLFCIVCKSPESFPQCTPKPILTCLDLSFPLASSDLGADSLENEFMMYNIHLSQASLHNSIQKSIDEMAALGHDTTSLDDEAFNLETSLDRCILRLIASCCNGDKLVRATELVKLLSLDKSVRGAIKLVTALKLPNLAERFNDILEEKLLNEAVQNTVLPDIKSNCEGSTRTNNSPSSKFFTAPDISKTSDNVVAPPLNAPSSTLKRKQNEEGPAIDANGTREHITTTSNDILPPSNTLSSNFFTRKKNVERRANDTNGTKKHDETTAPGKTIEVRNSTSSKDINSVKESKSGEMKQQVCSRPSNPFAKASNNDTSSLLDSLKKMKKADS